jgi:hypothetical protein
MQPRTADFKRPIFDDPPDDLGEREFHFGMLLPGIGGMEAIEVSLPFKKAGDRLLDAAHAQKELWEAAYPIPFSYRHAIEVFLKAPCLLATGKAPVTKSPPRTDT